MNWKLLTDKELASHCPLHDKALAAVAEVTEDGEVYSDTIILLDSDGMIGLPPTTMPLIDLFVLLDMLSSVARKRVSDEGHAKADQG